MLVKGFIALCLVVACSAQVVYLGRCPNVEVITDFKPESYVGKWYEQVKYPATFEGVGKCVTATYSALPNNMIAVKNTQSVILLNIERTIYGNATLSNPPTDGRLKVTLEGVPTVADYWILGTDYNYSVVYACQDFGLFNTRFLWILTKQSNPPLSVMAEAYRVLEKNGLSRLPLLPTIKANCPASYSQ